MVYKNDLRRTAVFYTCGTCNLNCRYCNIDKNPVLTQIDKELEKSFEGDYYLNRVKEYFPEKWMLRNIETWGGEPFLRMDRIYPLLRNIIKEYPYFDSMFSSTNFSYKTWIDQFFGLMDVFGEFPERYFKFTLQLSVDGPKEINDFNRGQGVTQRCLENFKLLVENLKNERLPKNVTLTITLKGTLDLDNIRALQDKQSIINYYKFAEDNYIDLIRSCPELQDIFIHLSIPNTAVPSPVTVNDGKLFANFCKLCREIEQENRKKSYFKYYTEITPYTTGENCIDCYGYESKVWGCGSGVSIIGFLPNNTVTSCHEGFIDIVDQYREYVKDRDLTNIAINFNKFAKDNKVQLSMTDEQYHEHEKKMATFIQERATAQLSTTTVQIIALALAGQVDEKYLDEETARVAALYFQTNCAFCIKDNYNQTGSFTLQPNGLFKLLLNGALDYIWPQGGNCQSC